MTRIEGKAKAADSQVFRNLVYDFSQLIDEDYEDYEDNGSLWDLYTHACYTQRPPVPALSLMKPILSRDETTSANFSHMEIGKNLPLILKFLSRVKVTELCLDDNALDDSCVPELINFLNNSDSLSSLNMSDNPMIKAQAMAALLEGVKEGNSLESLNISNTSGGPIVGRALGEFVTKCESLNHIEVSNCGLGAGATDFAAGIANCGKLEVLNLACNELCTGGKKLAQTLGASIARSGCLIVLKLQRNFITDDMAALLLKGLSDCPTLKYLDLSDNAIGEPSGKVIAAFISRAEKLKDLNLSRNPLLNIKLNQMKGSAQTSEDGKGKEKEGKAKPSVSSVYSILAAVAKCKKMKLTLLGITVDEEEWKKHVEPFAEMENIKIITQSVFTSTYNFGRRPQEKAEKKEESQETTQ